ncbi:MAG: tetratricopeptide repeat protein [Pseudomonadota bacterium]
MRRLVAGVLCLMVAGLSPAGDLMADAAHGHDHHHSHDRTARVVSPLQRARHLQRHHEFERAAELLAEVIENEPFNREAQLLYADVLLHDARIDEARAACVRVALAGAHVLAGYCSVQVLTASGEHDRAFAAATSLEFNQLSEEAQIWALEISAVAAWKAGQLQTADQWFRKAAAYPNVPHSTEHAYNEFRASLVY